MIRSKQILCLSLLGVSSAWSQIPMDSNGDGTVSLAELQAVRPEVTEERFSPLDTNGDGSLTMQELRSQRQRGREGLEPAAIDSDGDGVISLSELQAVRPDLTEEQFARLDRNGDGQISSDERPDGQARSFRGLGGRGTDRGESDDTTL